MQDLRHAWPGCRFRKLSADCERPMEVMSPAGLPDVKCGKAVGVLMTGYQETRPGKLFPAWRVVMSTPSFSGGCK